MQKPIDELVALIVNDLDPKLREEFEERAGIMEFDGQLTRRLAESLALLDVLRRHPAFLSGVTTWAVELEGSTQWVLTTNLSFARRHLLDRGGIELDIVELAEVVDAQYSGMAVLATMN